MKRFLFVFLIVSFLGGGVVRVAHAKYRWLVALDAGHGGRQLGTTAVSGVFEKDVALGIAADAAKRLKEKGVRVLMTRRDDRTVPLDARSRMAMEHKADVFVSIHANSAPVIARRGSETYILSVGAVDAHLASMLHMENEEVEGEGLRLETKRGGLQRIVEDLRRMAAHRESARLALRLQDSLGAMSGLRPSRGLRQAPFRVLGALGIPAALVEVGYLSNPDQAEFLGSSRGQAVAARAIARGVLRFLQDKPPRFR